MKPPQASISFSIGVPMRASRFFGSATAEPEMVTIRRHAGGEAAVNRTCGIYVEYRAAGVCRQLAGRNFTAGAGIDQLLLSTLRVLAGQRIQLEARIIRDQLFDLGEGILLVFLDRNDRGLYAHDVGQHLQAADGLFRTLEQQAMVGRNVRLTLCSVDDDRVALADTGLDLDMGREGCTAMADDAGRTDALDTLLIAHGSEVVGMHGLVLAVLAIIFNYDGQNLAAIRMQARLDCLYLAGNGSMDRSADKAAGFRDRLSQVHGIANRNDWLCRCADVHGNRQDYLIRQCQLLDRLGVCRGFIARVCVSTRVYAATERIRHFFHLSNILRKKNRTRARLPLLQKLAGYAWSIALQYRLYCFLYSIGKTKSKKKSNKIQINFVHLVKSIIFIRFFFVNNARVRSV